MLQYKAFKNFSFWRVYLYEMCFQIRLFLNALQMEEENEEFSPKESY